MMASCIRINSEAYKSAQLYSVTLQDRQHVNIYFIFYKNLNITNNTHSFVINL
jgi:hypothetical protein